MSTRSGRNSARALIVFMTLFFASCATAASAVAPTTAESAASAADAANSQAVPVSAQPSSQDGGPMVTILCYHHIDCGVKTEYSVTSSQLNAQIDGLLAAGFTFIDSKALEDFYEKGSPIPLKSALITIDDGNLDAYKHGFPLLKKRGIPFTVFVYPNNINSGHEKYCMDWDDLKDMVANGVTIGSHTMSHPFLTQPPSNVTDKTAYDAWLDNELINSRTELEARLGCSVTEFAVPFGAFDSYIRDRIQAAGYKLSFNVHGVNADSRSDKWNINRIIVLGTMTQDSFMEIATAPPIYFTDNTPADLSRVNVAKTTVSFTINGAQAFNDATVQTKMTSFPGLKIRYVKEQDRYVATINLKRPTFYKVSVFAKDKQGRLCRGAWLFIYNKKIPAFLNPVQPVQMALQPGSSVNN